MGLNFNDILNHFIRFRRRGLMISLEIYSYPGNIFLDHRDIVGGWGFSTTALYQRGGFTTRREVSVTHVKTGCHRKATYDDRIVEENECIAHVRGR